MWAQHQDKQSASAGHHYDSLPAFQDEGHITKFVGRGNSASQKVIPPNSEAQVRYYPLHTGSMISVRLRTGSPSPLSPSGVQVQLREVPTCISTSCLIILPSAHLSAARASPKSMGTRSCREAKGGTPSPSPQGSPS